VLKRQVVTEYQAVQIPQAVLQVLVLQVMKNQDGENLIILKK
jgi:hypothetical protein